MSFLHKYNILHRDLKPENVLEDKNYYPKVADFGLSKIVHRNKESMQMSIKSKTACLGTLNYMSPEIMTKCEYDRPGDVYAFAIIAYEIITLEEPNYNQIVTDSTKEIRPEFKVEIPDCYRQLIENCWATDPNQRPTFDEIVYILKSPAFLTKNIDKEEFFKYVNDISKYKSSYDKNKKIIRIDKIMTILNLNLNNYNIPKEKLLLDASNENNVDNDFSILNLNENSGSIHTSCLSISDLYNVDSFEKVKQIILNKCNDSNCIYIDTIATNILYNNRWLELPELIEVLAKFKKLYSKLNTHQNLYAKILIQF